MTRCQDTAAVKGEEREPRFWEITGLPRYRNRGFRFFLGGIRYCELARRATALSPPRADGGPASPDLRDPTSVSDFQGTGSALRHAA